MERNEALQEVERRDRVRLSALEREQYEMTRTKPRPRFASHRILPIPRELFEAGGATRWKCCGCGGTFNYSDEADDSPCPALEMFR